MIGAVLHLWQRAVDRLGDALEGPEMASLRVTLAALSARVAAAEGEAARLRGELAGLRQTDHDVRTWCEQAADAMDAAYAAGFRYGVDHPGEAFRDACDLGVYLDDQQMRVEWNHGRQDEAAARRLGEDTRAMADAGVQGPSLTDPALVIVRLLDERDAARAEYGETRRLFDDVAGRRDAALADVVRLTREQGELRQRFHEVLRELGQTRVSAHATAEYAGKAEQLRHDLDDLRRLVRAFKVAEDAYFEAEGNVAILGADNAMCAAKADLFAALPTEVGNG